jgi:multiple sugar transport system ATP-binding protein
MARIELERATVISGRTRRLDDVSLAVAEGDFVGVVGASGSGKSTLLRAIGGLERLASGTIRFDGVDVTTSRPGERDVSLVFQEPALLGHLNARRNVSFPLDVRHRDREEIRNRVDAEVRALRIEELMHRNPSQLSHGEQQMVQIGRALVRTPRVLLLDEPFASLDEPLRHRMRAEIGMLQEGYGVTTLMSTNDPLDVVTLAKSVVVVHDGRIVQVGPTAAVRRSPVSLVAAAATGHLSVVEMTVVGDREGFWLMREDPRGGELVRIRAWTPGLARYVGSTVVVGVRPEHLVVHATGTIPATVERRIPVPTGSVQCSVAGALLMATTDPSTTVASGDAVHLRIDHLVAFDRATDLAIT